ncbi:hypothetical protein [Terrisporobacter mayombei]|uniref:Bypass of forespore C C-terminal domain-containing protein n=1 Tax=Terrisporobacter mayombei TaxID=1541 RepID=A0ABY9Q600_9FIRM|nr:hypothetical protein [Terrisporobacter mayombei]MCC3868884.1 hypothetical protein [Terrisporobacter mayombei]WMT82981.1 hypothetical protein TEMA_34790 [Terrisporobacter mayombei]
MKLSKSKLIGLVIAAGISIIGGKFVYDNFLSDKDDFPYRLTYISMEGNNEEKEQEEAIKNCLKDTEVNEVDFSILQLDKRENMVIKESVYNKLAKKLDVKEVKLNDDEAMIIPSYDGIKNIKYLKEQKSIKSYKLKDKDLKIVGVLEKKILVSGIDKHQFVISDKLYDEFSKDSKTVNIKGYDFKDNNEIQESVSNLFTSKLFDINNNDLFYLIGKDNTK